MASAEEFSKGIAAIPGIRSYLLVRKDGLLITHNLVNPEELAAAVVSSGLGAAAVKSSLGGSCFRYLAFARANQEKLLVFPIGNYFIGIVQDAETSAPELAAEVIQYILILTNNGPTQAS